MFQLILKALREEKSLSQAKFAKLVGVGQSTVAMWESGKNKPEYTTLLKIATIFDVSIDYLTKNESDNTSLHQGVKIPVLGRVAAGVPIEAVQEIIDYEEITSELNATGEFFALQIKGNSMEPRIKENDIVIVRKQEDIESSHIAVVLINGQDATVKKITKHANGISLVAFNPTYAPVFYTDEEISTIPIRIIGRVVELRGKF